MAHPRIPIYLFTFNCARLPQDPALLSSHIFSGLAPDSEPPALVVLALQELAPISTSFIGGTLLDPYYEPFVSAVYSATRKNFGEQYTLVGKNTIGFTGILAFAKDPEKVKNVEYAGTGVGLCEMGNKGGLGLKIEYEPAPGEEIVEMIFVAAHLAPDEFRVKRRNQDWESIVRNVVFEPENYLPSDSGEPKRKHGIYTPTSHLFVMGDFNYRTSGERPKRPDEPLFPQPDDPPESPSHWEKLLENDQLGWERGLGNVFHGLEEEEVTFPPTYKYRITPVYDESIWDWAPNRWPSWTDRILYLPLPHSPEDAEEEGIKVLNYTSIPRINTSDHKPVALHLSIPATPLVPTGKGIRENPPFEINENWRERRDAARKKELIVGAAAYLLTTRAGLAILLALTTGTVAGYYILRALAQ
ncbi:hypothetical protein RUND412_001274 [Rhizina undulata]